MLRVGGEAVANGRLSVEVLQPSPDGSTGVQVFAVLDGAIVDRITGEPVTIVSPANYRMTLRYNGRMQGFVPLIGVEESDDPVAWEDIVEQAGSAVDPSTIVRAGDDVTRLSGSGNEGDVPTLGVGGAISWQPQQGASGTVTSVNGETGDVEIPNATTDEPGLMSEADKAKLEAIESGALATASVNALITSAVNALLDGAPGALNTLNELAAAVNDDASFAATVTTALGNRYTKAETDALLLTITTAATTEASTRAAGDTALATRATKLESYAGIADGVYDLDDMPQAYATWLTAGGLSDTDARRLQWCINRLTLSDDGLTAVQRNVVILVGDREYDVTSAAFQQTGTLGTYVHGTLYGACAQILIPKTGDLALKKILTLTFRAKTLGVVAYSVVNGDGANGHVLHTNAVIKSTATPPSGEVGNYAMIGADRSGIGYANIPITGVIPVFEGVTFRAGTGITPFDANFCASVDGTRYIADVGITAEVIHNYDPRFDASGNRFVTGAETEIEERKRTYGLKTPLLWNDARMKIDFVETMGFRNGLEWNEHLVVVNHFSNYCYAANKLRGMSHIATLVHNLNQRCPIHFEAPPTSDWNGNEPLALMTVLHTGGEAYHPGENGNPVGDRWYNHVARIWDPNDLWDGEIVSLYESPSMLPENGWTTLPSGHGGLLQIRRHGEAWGAGGDATDLTQPQTLLTPSGGIVAAPLNTGSFGNYYAVADAGLDVVTWDVSGGDAIVDGAEGVISLHYSTGDFAGTIEAPAGYTIHVAKEEDGTTDKALPASVDNLHVDLPYRVQGSRIFYDIVSHGALAGLTTEGGGGETVIIEDTFTAANGTTLNGRAPSPTAGGTTYSGPNLGDVTIQANAVAGTAPNGGGNDYGAILPAATAGGSATSVIETVVTLAGTEQNTHPCVVNRSNVSGEHWTTRVYADTGIVALRYRDTGGGVTEYATWNSGSAMSGTHTFRMQGTDDTVKVWVDGTLRINYTHPSTRPSKTNTGIGFWGINTTATLDNLKVINL